MKNNNNTLIKAIDLVFVVEGRESRCGLDFDDFSEQEMYTKGFCGPVELDITGQGPVWCEMVAVPVWKDREAPEVKKGLAFHVYDPDGRPLAASVKQFHYR